MEEAPHSRFLKSPPAPDDDVWEKTKVVVVVVVGWGGVCACVLEGGEWSACGRGGERREREGEEREGDGGSDTTLDERVYPCPPVSELFF